MSIKYQVIPLGRLALKINSNLTYLTVRDQQVRIVHLKRSVSRIYYADVRASVWIARLSENLNGRRSPMRRGVGIEHECIGSSASDKSVETTPTVEHCITCAG